MNMNVDPSNFNAAVEKADADVKKFASAVRTAPKPPRVRGPENAEERTDAMPVILEIRHAPAGGREQFFTATEVRVEGGTDGEPLKIKGYAAVFNQLSKPLATAKGKTFREQIEPGAFTDSLASDKDIFGLVGHDPSKVIARRSAGNLTLTQDDKGLAFEITPADTTLGRDAVADVRCGNVRGMSFGFGKPEDEWKKDGDQNIRTLKKVPLGEVSLTPYPAYEGTAVDVRSIDEALDQLEHRGHVPGYSMVASNCRSTMMAAREAWETMHRAGTELREVDGPLNDSEKRSIGDLHGQLGALSKKVKELRSVCAQHMETRDDDDMDGDDTSDMNAATPKVETPAAEATPASTDAGAPILRKQLERLCASGATEPSPELRAILKT